MAKKRGGKGKPWTAAGAARSARDARVATARYLREAPSARLWEAERLSGAHQPKAAHLGDRGAALQLLLTGLGYDQGWLPKTWAEAAERVVTDEAAYLDGVELYVLSPQMCDVVVAAAQSLTLDDIGLLTEQDLPSRTGLLMLPRPLLVRASNGNLGDDRAYHWQATVPMKRVEDAAGGWTTVPAVRVSSFHDSYGPVRPDTFVQFAEMTRVQGYPLPPLLLDGIQCVPYGKPPSAEQARDLEQYLATTRQVGQRNRAMRTALGTDEDRVIGEYEPGSEITNTDGAFTIRFLYAFWRLCAQNIAVTEPAEVRHAARLAAEKAGVSPDVRVVQLRTAPSGDPDTAGAGDTRWNHRWMVRMHKVRQWYPSEQRHKVIYRGPYIKGPENKPLLGGDVVRTMTR